MRPSLAAAAVACLALLVWLMVRAPERDAPAVVGASPATERDPAVRDATASGALAPDPTHRADVAEEVDSPGEPAAPIDPARGALVVSVVFREGGDPVPETPVLLFRGDADLIAWQRREAAATDAQGVARFDGLDPGAVTVRCVLGGERQAQVVAGGEAAVRIAVPRGFAIDGSVVDADEQPVGGAEIWLSEAWSETHGLVVARTGSDGRFVLEHVNAHRFVGARARDLLPSPILAVKGDPGEAVQVALVLTRGAVGRVEGRVVDAALQPLAGARVVVGDEEPRARVRAADGSWTPGPPPVTAVCGADGSFVAEWVVPGRRVLRARAEGYAPAARELDVPAGVTTRSEIVLTRGARLSGIVRGPDGRPVGDVHVYSRPARFEYASTRSAGDGSYALDGLAPGSVEILARAADGTRGFAALELADGEARALDIELAIAGEPAAVQAVRGRLVDAQGEPLAGWRVVATAADGGVAGVRTSTGSRRDGTFSLPVEWPVVNVFASPPAEWSRFPPIFAAGLPADPHREVTLRAPAPLESSGSIRGRLVDAAGAPRRARVEVWHTELRLYAAIDNDPDTGEFVLDHVQPGPNKIDVQCKDDPWIQVGVRDVAVGRVLDLGDLVVAPSGRIRGTVSMRGGEPLPDELRIVVVRAGSEAGVVRCASGRFDSSALAAADDYLLIVQGDGVQTAVRTVAVRAGETTEVALDLARGAVRELRFELAEERPPLAWFNVQVRDAGGRQVWYGSGNPARTSLPLGELVVTAYGPGGELGRWPLRVDTLADVAPITFRVD